MSTKVPAAADGADGLILAARIRVLWAVVITVVVLAPAVHLLAVHPTGRQWAQIALAVVLAALACWAVTAPRPACDGLPWPLVAALLVLAPALFVLGGVQWVGPLAVGAAVSVRFSTSARLVMVTSAIYVIVGSTVAVIHHYSFGNTVSAVVVAPLAALFAYSLGRRADAMDSLRRTRAELARAAAAEERLRIARDLHDLLGHSLSLITLKAQLAGRLMTADPDGAAVQIAELESVARQSLSDVREAVAGFRQPDLAGELAAARRLLDAAGISSQITAPDTSGLAAQADAVLAWAVREGTTNVVRHSRATQVAVSVSRDRDAVTAEIRDDGRPATTDDGGQAHTGHRQPTAGPDGRAVAMKAALTLGGSGLAGLAERVRVLGGELSAGFVEPQGFLLRVVVPLRARAGQ